MQKYIFKHKNKIMIVSLFLIITGYISNFGFQNKLIFNITFIISSIIGVIPILILAYQSLKVKVISIEVLVTIAVIGAFIIKSYEESAIVTFLFLFGSYLEFRTLNKTRSAIKELSEMAPSKATLIKNDNQYEEIDIDLVSVNDLLLVRTGEKVPVDATIIKGSGYLNESSITGEPMALFKDISDIVYAGTILENGTLEIKANKVGYDTVFGKIIELVEEASDSKSKAEKFIDKFSNYYTPFVLLLALIVWTITKDLPLAITILVLGCPGALVIGIPVSNVAGIGNGARNGILLKGSEVISDFSKVDTIIFDKTGTLTTGKPYVASLKYYTNDINKANNYLVKIEEESSHPLAKAIINHFNINSNLSVNDTNVVKGLGIIAKINNEIIHIGNPKLIETNNIHLTKDMKETIIQYQSKGYSIVIHSINYKVQMILGIGDEIRLGIKNDLSKLKRYGVKELIILSGDNQEAVNIVANQLNFDKAFGNMLPEDKANYVKKLKEEGKIVAFIGDGINDSPSLALANIGIAVGSGTDIAIETSDVVLMNSNFSKIPHALGLSKKIINNMIQNILISLGVVLFLILSLLFSDWLNMSIGMLMHEASILIVILNGMRLLRFKTKN